MQALSRGLPKLISLALGFKRSLACSFIFTTMVGALLLSCRNQVADEIDSIAFNPTIRRDLHALTQAQRQGNLSPFYNNGHLGDGEISELYPIPPDLGSEDSVRPAQT